MYFTLLETEKSLGTQNIVVDGVLIFLTLPGSSPNASDIIAAIEKPPVITSMLLLHVSHLNLHSTTTAVTKHCFHK